ncbi:hypothetical protein CBE01nite_23430 [Clostridium beijerinckii]|uniref:Uncharacterized protein n=1 Tax=Clostridium beijerinckii TaxID=1520 RepID=A0AB74VDN8_CLOBE|nr:hypothetical protein [Clostridium beijerinckii]NRZ28833.1 hypothetical protein [Clostridium beijerinckii]NYB95393.1 hypothetical protein [Clostridium beijerinckii]OOM26905.1 hypothetical protein CLBEI_08500 [Clostridium beijerinckii]QUN34505.1 hypothetical protein KEC93_21670 [Clostridium beijerinckii]SQB00537.1 Uncharacterised protein [Clostridium beijerinckii]
MDEREELKKELEQELQWIIYRQRLLDIMEQKLLQMKKLTEKAKYDNLIEKELELINVKLNDLAMQVKALDSESRKSEDWKMIR